MGNNQFNWPIIGHKKIIEFLQKSIINNKVNQSYFFVGQKNLGKKAVADEFIRSLLCEHGNDGTTIPCRECSCCKKILASSHPDFYNVDIARDAESGKANKDIKIEQIRELQGKLSHRTLLKSYKIALIDNADLLNTEAANSLLKTLEEPTPKTVLILIAQSENNLPSTIISRCQILKFFPVNYNLIFDHLISFGAPRLLAENLSKVASGRPGIAINFFQNSELYDEYKMNSQRFIDILAGSVSERLGVVAEVTSQKGSGFTEQINILKNVLHVWSGVIRDLLLVKNSCSHLIRNIFVKVSIEALANKYTPDRLAGIANQIDDTARYLSLNINPKLVFENLVINI